MTLSDKYHNDCWPKGRHLWLMQAALLEGNLARDAWEKWSQHLDVDNLDYPSYQVIPKLYKNLQKLHVEYPQENVFKGIYYHTWVENKKNFYFFEKLVQDLYHNGINKIVLLKGSAMILSCYHDFGIRQMGDIDFLVPKSLALKAMRQLICLGFQPTPYIQTDDIYLEEKIKMQHGINFVGNENFEKLCIDIHWNILYDIHHDNINEDWIDNSDIASLGELKIGVLNPTYLLYQTCIHGVKYSPMPLTRWVMDAVTLINMHHNTINWQEIFNQARKDHLLLPLRSAFNYLSEHFNVFIPQHMIDSLNKSSILWQEKISFELRQHAFLSLLLIPIRLWTEHSRAMPKESGFLSKVIYFPQYLQKRCGLKQLWYLPFYMPFKIMLTIKNRFVTIQRP